MHHRLDTPTRLTLPVRLRKNGVSLGCFRTRDIDARGVFVEARSTGLQPHDGIEIDFLFDGSGMQSQAGVVVRRAEDGVAVTFCTRNLTLFEALDDLLLDQYPPAYNSLAS